MIIGIIGAMEKEVLEIKNRIKIEGIETKAGMEFYKGKYEDRNVVVVKCGIGKVNAAISSQILIDDFNVDLIINTGIAGGVKSGINTGDVVISTDIVYHDVDTTVFGDKLGQVPNMDVFSFKADNQLIDIAYNAAQNIQEFNAFKGRIVSGDQFIADDEKLEFIRNEFQAYAVEMEGAAIGHTCFLNNVPFVVIRSISDGADGSAHIEYEKFQYIAINNSVTIINNMIKKL